MNKQTSNTWLKITSLLTNKFLFFSLAADEASQSQQAQEVNQEGNPAEEPGQADVPVPPQGDPDVAPPLKQAAKEPKEHQPGNELCK